MLNVYGLRPEILPNRHPPDDGLVETEINPRRGAPMPPRSGTSARGALEMRVSLSSRRTSPLVFDHPLLQGTIAPLSRRAPVAPAARRRAVLRQPHTGYSLYAGHDVVEVLTKCRVQHLLRGKDPFVAAGVRTER